MNLPLPEFREGCLPDDPDSRERFLEFHDWVKRLEPAVKTELHFSKDRPLEFPGLLASWLLASLQRVRITAWGVISSVNSENEVLFVLAIRTLIESTSYVAYVDRKLRESYDGTIARRAMTHLAFRMKFSTRAPASLELTGREAELTSAVNVLTAIGYLDDVARREFGLRGDKPVSNWYESLCEFCHPNMLGNSAGSELVFPGKIEVFDVEPGIRPAVRDQFGQSSRFTLLCFCMLYNRCWDQLFDNHEVLPTWVPNTDPRIVAE